MNVFKLKIPVRIGASKSALSGEEQDFTSFWGVHRKLLHFRGEIDLFRAKVTNLALLTP